MQFDLARSGILSLKKAEVKSSEEYKEKVKKKIAKKVTPPPEAVNKTDTNSTTNSTEPYYVYEEIEVEETRTKIYAYAC